MHVSRQHVCWCLAAVLALLLSIVVGCWFYAVQEEITAEPCKFFSTLPNKRNLILIGREADMITVTEMLRNSSTQILSITGPPGVGKSTLAVHIGWRMVETGAYVSYINMNDVPSNTTLIMKVLHSFGVDVGENDPTDEFIKWAKGVSSVIVLIFDNCDDHLHSPNFQHLFTNLQKYLSNLKVLMTNREATLYLDGFEEYPLHSLSNESAKRLLRNITQGIKLSSLERICELVGNLPLALKITAKVLKHRRNICDVDCVISELQRDPTEVLCPEELPESESVCPSFALSYQRLGPGYQQCGRYLANFPGSFELKAATAVLAGDSELGHVNAQRCISKLVRSSLLEVYKYRTNITKHDNDKLLRTQANITRYNLHQLIKALFLAVQEGNKSLEISEFNTSFQLHYTSEFRRSTEHPRGHVGYPGYQSIVLEEIRKEALNLKHVAAAIIEQNIASAQVLVDTAIVLFHGGLYVLDPLDMFAKELGTDIPQFVQASFEYLDGIDLNTLPTQTRVFPELIASYLYLTFISNSWHHEERCEGMVHENSFKPYCSPLSDASLHEFERRAQTVETLHYTATQTPNMKYAGTLYRKYFYMLYSHCCECYASLHFQVCKGHWEYWLKGEVVTEVSAPLYVERSSNDTISLGLRHYDVKEYRKAVYHLEYGLTPENMSKDCVLSRMIAVMALYAMRKENQSQEQPIEKTLSEAKSTLLGKLNLNSKHGCQCPYDIESVFQSFLREVLQEEYDKILRPSVLMLPECCADNNLDYDSIEEITFPLCKLLKSGTRIKHLHI